MLLSEFNAGAYEPQYEYQSFKPSLIHQNWLMDDPKLLQLLGEADRAVGELNAFARLIPDIDFIISMYVAKEATQSSRIEGTQTNIEDAFKDAEDLNPEERDDWLEVQNYIQAINWAVKELERLPLSGRLLRETHKILMQGARGERKMPGEFRTSQNWIGVSLENAAFVPPHQDHVMDLMHDLELFLNDPQIAVPPLVRVAMAHYQFETIHPFLDGNGRLGRLMISLYLAAEGLLSKPALYLSDYLERNKTAYVDHLMAVREGHHMRDWLIFMLQGIRETARASIERFQYILDLKARIDQKVMPHFSTRRQANAQKLIQSLYARPITDVKAVEAMIEGGNNTASALVSDFVKHGVLLEFTGQRRNRLFVFRDYMKLFRD